LAKASVSRRSTQARRLVKQRDPVLLIADAADPDLATTLCASARLVLEDGGSELLVCDVRAIADPDLGSVDALARLTLEARQLGGDVVLLDAAAELRELLDLAGLASVVPCVPPRSGGKPGR
jgi:hypothetical protein